MSETVRRGTDVVVVGVDGSDEALHATRWAARHAAQRGASLLLIYATNLNAVARSMVTDTAVLDDQYERLRRSEGDILEVAQAAANQAATVHIQSRLEAEGPAMALRHASREATMLVLGAAGRGTLGTALGSVTLTVAAHAECPVVVVRGELAEETTERPVVVGVDGGPLSEPALAYAFSAASREKAPLTAVHVWTDTDMQRAHLANLFDTMPWEPMKQQAERALSERLAGWSERFPDVAVERVIKRDDPRNALVELSHDARVVVVASRGRGGFAGLLLGSTTLALIQRAACPVMLVGPESSTHT